MKQEPRTAGRGAEWSRRALLWRAFGVGSLSLLAACGPAAAPAPTSAPAPAPAPTQATAATAAPAAKPTQPAAAAPPLGPTVAPTVAPAAKPTAAPVAASGGAATGTLRYANADFGQEALDPILIGTQWGWAIYDSLLTFDNQ